MINGMPENNSNQVTASTVHPPPTTTTISIPETLVEEDSQENLPDPPAALSTLVSPVKSNGNGSHHYDTIGSSETEVVTKTVTKMVNIPKLKGFNQRCSFWAVIFGTLIISLLVFILVWNCQFFGYCSHGPNINNRNETEMGQGNILALMDYSGTNFTNNSINPNNILALNYSLETQLLTSTPLIDTTTNIATTKTNTLDLNTKLTHPFGKNQPTKTFTVAELRSAAFDSTTLSPTTASSLPSTTTISTTHSTTISSTISSTTTFPSTTTTITKTETFEEKDKNVFGNMSLLLSDKNRFVFSPFILNYILSFTGKFGDISTKAAIENNYFGAMDINKIYDYYSNFKESFFASKSQNSWFLLNAFISGDNPTQPPKRFMEEITEIDRIPIYPASPDYSYETFYNEMIKKNIYDKERYNRFFVKNELQTSPQKVVGFSHLQNSLKFKKVKYNKIERKNFISDGGKIYKVNMFVTNSAYEDFEGHRLYQIPFADNRYTFFIVQNRGNTLIPNVNLFDILEALKTPNLANKKEAVICVPEIHQQNTYDLTKFIDFSVAKNLSFAFEKPLNSQIIDKYYQAIRFDINAEGLNLKTREHQPFKFRCQEINQTFIYGIFFKDHQNPGHEALLYYGLFI